MKLRKTDPDDEHDLYWHALNFRTAAPQHAESMWKELEACVQGLIADAKSDAADEARDWYERNYDPRY